MILYPDNLLALDYNIGTDTLTVKWPSLTTASVPELKVAIHKLIDAVNHYDVKRLLIDSSKSKVDIPEAVYKPIVFGLIQALAQTRLEKMARVLPEDEVREIRLRTYHEEMTSQKMYTFQTSEFISQKVAQQWLSL
jgi:hypothetical protein